MAAVLLHDSHVGFRNNMQKVRCKVSISFLLRVGILAVLFFALAATIFICISRFILKRPITKLDICRLVFIEYVAAWTIIYVFFRIEVLSLGLHLNRMTLQPFESYIYAIKNFSAANWFKVFRTTVGLLPFGLLCPLVIKRVAKLKWTLVYALIFTVALEFTMLFLNMGMFHIDHIVNGLLGACIGYGVYALIANKVFKHGENRAKI